MLVMCSSRLLAAPDRTSPSKPAGVSWPKLHPRVRRLPACGPYVHALADRLLSKMLACGMQGRAGLSTSVSVHAMPQAAGRAG